MHITCATSDYLQIVKRSSFTTLHSTLCAHVPIDILSNTRFALGFLNNQCNAFFK